MNKLISTLLVSAAAFSINAYAEGDADKMKVLNENELKWTEGRVKGVMSAMIVGAPTEPGFFMYRSKFPAGFVVQPHTHPAAEHITVVSGTFYLGQGEQVEEAKTTPIKAGGAAIIPPRLPHFVIIKEETVIQQQGVGPTAINFLTDGTKK
jgi:quercetin dioxygenase-like cupin family protein